MTRLRIYKIDQNLFYGYLDNFVIKKQEFDHIPVIINYSNNKFNNLYIFQEKTPEDQIKVDFEEKYLYKHRNEKQLVSDQYPEEEDDFEFDPDC